MEALPITVEPGQVVEVIGVSRFTWEKAGDGIRLIPVPRAPQFRLVGQPKGGLLRHRRIEPGGG